MRMTCFKGQAPADHLEPKPGTVARPPALRASKPARQAYRICVLQSRQAVVQHVVVGCGHKVEVQHLEGICVFRRQLEIEGLGGGLAVTGH